ncbi:tyrosine-type recombinase/integrase [Enterovirga rhinocerotis]|uniref:Integrase n=1 Tax=Enterovirga rhinocerotis TaxID=1339210 RepID=A0A4R7C7L2_9HYPH|nr:integrase arm-type DNA-binding domain-containing protein [Enterovirga rhinocerotis]TDR94281.1 integrase [Enterovirga rhinocerotis]
MARVLNKLNDRAVKSAAGPGRLADGGGLHLVIDASGARRWLFRYRLRSREREAGFGGYPAVGLADARRRRDEARALLAAGGDPIEAKRKAEAEARPSVTFGDFADELVPTLAAGFRNEKRAAQWTSTLKAYAASLRSKPIAEVSTDDVLDVLKPIWSTKSETASRVRGRIERILDAAKAKGLRSGENPARWRGHLDQRLPRRKKLQRGHHRALPYPDVPAFLVALRTRTGVAARALEFPILTAARTSEVTELPWSEVDLEGKVWTVPAERMKREQQEIPARSFSLRSCQTARSAVIPRRTQRPQRRG